IAITIFFGYEFWQNQTKNNELTASSLYADMLLSIENNKAETLFAQATKIKESYASTAYAPLAAMLSAKQYAKNNENEKSANELKWAIDHADEKIVSDLAKMQLARVYIAMQKFPEANTLLKEEYPAAWQSSINELNGDIQAAKQNWEKARNFYQLALRSTKGGSTEFLQMKLDNLAQVAQADNANKNEKKTTATN
ncbi:MAG TPA: tetratricopeptide repeat protein, partial [Thiothrix sp.]|nr:tetratricopeptide repeat protein [Thiothrix sp.]